MRVFIVHAHAEPTSFNGSMTRAATNTLAAAGHDVVVSDLHVLGFDPVSDRRNFMTVADASVLKQQAEESFASANNGYVPELQAEMDKVGWCDVMIFQFPIWWLGLPAILKGWVERVFAVGRAYGGGRWFETAACLQGSAPCARSPSAGRGGVFRARRLRPDRADSVADPPGYLRLLPASP